MSDQFDPLYAEIFSRYLFADWNEDDHPRVPAGDEAGGQFTSKDSGASSPASKHGPEARQVGIEKVKALSEHLISSGASANVSPSEEDTIPPPETWDMVNGDQQQSVKDEWISDHQQEFIDSEVENWWSDTAPEDARNTEVWKQTDWATETAANTLESYGVDLQQSGLLDAQGQPDSQKILGQSFDNQNEQWKWNGGGDQQYVMKDNSGLFNPDIFNNLKDENGQYLVQPSMPNQLGLQGVPQAGNPADSTLAMEMRNQFESEIYQKTTDPQSFMEAPDSSYFSDMVDEWASEAFDQKSDSEKFDLAQAKYGEDWNAEAGIDSSTPQKIVEPDTYKLVSDGEDYQKTKILGNALVTARFEQVLNERGIDANKINEQHAIDKVWNDWKASSTSQLGYALQAAAAEELGGNFHESHAGLTLQDAKDMANESFPGGYDGLKAYVRSQWEVNQFLMQKAGLDHLDVYRALYLSKSDVMGKDQAVDGGYLALPTLFIRQNGAASFTTQAETANHWAGVGKMPPAPERVVIRARVPSESILSLPVFGKNLQAEREVVVSGLPWHSWDAWRNEAPTFNTFELGHPRGPDGRFIDKPDGMQKAA